MPRRRRRRWGTSRPARLAGRDGARADQGWLATNATLVRISGQALCPGRSTIFIPLGRQNARSKGGDLRLLRILSRLGLIASLAASILFASSGIVHAGHTIAGGDCWKGGTPLWCRRVWVQGQSLHVKLIDRFSDARPAWRNLAEDSRNRWTRANGPQVLSWNTQANDTWIYLSDVADGEHGTVGLLGITWNCDINSFCSAANIAMNVWWTDIYLNRTEMDATSNVGREWTFSHEIGHSLGLYHHLDLARLMNPFQVNVLGPTNPGDLGTLPPCSVANGGGVRCVYNWPT